MHLNFSNIAFLLQFEEEGSDYIAVTSTLMFPVCHMANIPKCTTITIVSDTQTEAIKTFNVTLSGVLYSGIVLYPSEAVIVITDEAGK